MSSGDIEKLFNTIIKANALYHKINPETLINELQSYNRLDINEPMDNPNLLKINSIKQGQNGELYIVRPIKQRHIWICIPRK